MLTQIRTLIVTDGESTREMTIHQRADGTYWLQDDVSDPAGSGLWQIQDDSDTSVMDAIRDNGWEIVD